MPNLAQTLAMTTPVSTLLRKARRLGLHGVDALIALAVARGCHHYASDRTPLVAPPPKKHLATMNSRFSCSWVKMPMNPPPFVVRPNLHVRPASLRQNLSGLP